MDWLQAPDYWLARLVIERALGVIYTVAFLVAVNQFRPLLGEKGLLPGPLMPPLPPRDAADAESSELVLPPPPQAAPPGRGVGQRFRPAAGAVVTLCAPAGGFVSGRDHRPRAGLARAGRQFLVAELS